jgi:hypothetical protein
MKLTGENRQLGGKPVPVPLCAPQTPHELDKGSNPDLGSERPTTNRLSHVKALACSLYRGNRKRPKYMLLATPCGAGLKLGCVGTECHIGLNWLSVSNKFISQFTC